MDEKQLKALFERASKIAESVPQSMQEAAFNRALNLLLKEQEFEPDEQPDKKPTGHAKPQGRKHRPKTGQAEKVRFTPKAQSGRPGPKAVLQELVNGGFFKSPKTIGDIQSHLAKKKGQHYKTTELSPTLLRLIRDEVLDRDENKNGQYEYKSR
jgi:hypothetical protein